MVYGDNQGFDDFPRLSGAWSEANYVQPGSAIFRLPDNLSAERVICARLCRANRGAWRDRGRGDRGR